ncbi:MAG: electron transport complex subunit RsxC [Proteobacteria bacterium]|jgi:Na+-translocating ferredoxin:NAD+ oxidoreductase subunit C|nr:electron transport complex subunit RsxC [Pseudomonadota bacterium]
MKRRLWHFHGGLHLPEHKQASMTKPVVAAALPDEIILPMQQHIGSPAEPVVKVGEHVLKGQRVAKASEYVSAPVHASTSGEVIAIEERGVPHPSGLPLLSIVIKPDGKDEWTELKPVPDYAQLDPSALRNVIRDAGIVGLGGAGFPSFIKLNPGPDNAVDTLILNGAECEPYITCDAMLMQERPRDIIDGLLIMKHALRARHCIIAIEDNKKVALTLLKNSLQEHEAEFLKIVSIPTIYPSGGEKQLIRILTGKEVPSHGLPIDIGVVCHNVATAAAICKVINEGKPLVERYITVTGETLDQPRNLKVRIGTPCIDLLNACGWREDQTDEVLMGGPMMGFGIPALDMPTVKTSNCLLARPKDQPHQQPAMPCIRCGQCAAVCPAQLLPQQMYWYARARDFDKIQAYNLFDCIECGCCAYVCPSRIPLVQYYRFAKTEIWAKERDKEKADHARQRHEFRLQRLERKKKEDEERRRRKKELLKKTQPKSDSEADIKQAAIQAAMDRVKAKRATQEQQKKNIENLNEKQQQAIEAVEKRRQRLRNAGADNEENP